MLSHSSIPEDPLTLTGYRHLTGLRKEQITLTSNGVCSLWAVGEAGPIIRPLGTGASVSSSRRNGNKEQRKFL